MTWLRPQPGWFTLPWNRRPRLIFGTCFCADPKQEQAPDFKRPIAFTSLVCPVLRLSAVPCWPTRDRPASLKKACHFPGFALPRPHLVP
jgi:hypothetical protein